MSLLQGQINLIHESRSSNPQVLAIDKHLQVVPSFLKDPSFLHSDIEPLNNRESVVTSFQPFWLEYRQEYAYA